MGPTLDRVRRGPIILVPFADVREVTRLARVRAQAFEAGEGTNIHGPTPGAARWAVCSLETRVAFEMRVDGMSARHRYFWCWASHEKSNPEFKLS